MVKRLKGWPPFAIVALIAIVIAAVGLIPSLYGIHQNSKNVSQLRQYSQETRRLVRSHARLVQLGAEAHQAVCGMKANTAAQIAASKAYLADLKAGRRQPLPGITANDIKIALGRQQNFYGTVKHAKCSPEVRPHSVRPPG